MLPRHQVPCAGSAPGSSSAVGTMMMGRRRFVNLVAENIESGAFSVHRLNVSEHLFYPSTAEAEGARPAAVSRLGALPPPVVSFYPAPDKFKGQLFALVSSRILWSSPSGQTTLYDAESNSNYAMPCLSYKGYDPIAISVVGRPDAPEEDLYVMSAGACCPDFEVLRFGYPKVNLLPDLPEAWQLESLPSASLPSGAIIRSHAVLHGGRTICVTAADAIATYLFDPVERDATTDATYLFDMVEREWREAPDGCNLPFSSGAEYDPNLKLWLGLCTSKHHLCASSDLDLAVDKGKPPTVKHQWEIVATPEAWEPSKVSVINLGGGRFCIFKIIHDVVRDKDSFDDWGDLVRQQLALLTGVEIISSSPQGLVRMVTHKSLSYIFTKDRVERVL